MHRVDERRVELSFSKGDLLCKQGALMSHIIYVRKGFVKLYMENEGEITILSIAKPGTFIGIQALYGEAVFPFSAEAMSDTEICLKDIGVFRQLVIENPEFAKGIIEILNANLVQSYKRMFSLSTKQIDVRFSELLLYMSNVMYDSNPFQLTISRKEIAGLVSTSAESVSRLFSDFKARGIIKSEGQTVEILDADKLQNICQCDTLDIYKL
jgi:CRP/FNR family transcriptional regulator